MQAIFRVIQPSQPFGFASVFLLTGALMAACSSSSPPGPQDTTDDASVATTDAPSRLDQAPALPDFWVEPDLGVVDVPSTVDADAVALDLSQVDADTRAQPDLGPQDLSPPYCAAQWSGDAAPLLVDLWFISESDEPFTVFSAPSANTGPILTAEFQSLIQAPGSLIEMRPYVGFFDGLSMYDENVAQYQNLGQLFDTKLTDLVIFRVGEIEIDVYIIGRTACGEVVGVQTMSVET